MNTKHFFISLLLSATLFSSKAQQSGNLTVFSEDGDKFYLILNGEQQNDEPQSNMRVEDLPQPYYSARIIFEDKSLATITKNNLMIIDADEKFMDVTYKIKKDKTKKPKLNFYSMIPVKDNFMPPSGMYVHQFGQPRQQQGSGGYGQTTTTTTTAAPTTTTTTTSTTSSSITTKLSRFRVFSCLRRR